MSCSQIYQLKDFKILCVHGFEVECFVWGNPGKYDEDDATSFEMETNYFISNKTKYFRKIHFGWAVICFTKALICSGSLLPQPGAVFHFPPPQIAHHTENPSITSPKANFLSALCFSHTVLLGWKVVCMTRVGYALLSNHGKPHKQKDSLLMNGFYKTPSLLVPGFFGKRWWFSYRRSQVRSLCQMLAERLLSPVDVEVHFSRFMSSGPDPSIYYSQWLLCEQGEQVRNHLKEICIVSSRG